MHAATRTQQEVSEGFSLSVTLLDDYGKEVRTEEYYRGCKLVLRARGVTRFTGLYLAAVSAEGMWEGYQVRAWLTTAGGLGWRGTSPLSPG